MIVRNALVSDLDAIMAVEKSSFITSIQEERTVFEQRILRCPKLFLVFEFEGKVCGYLSAEFLEKIPQQSAELKLGHLPEPLSASVSTESKFIYISSFALLPEVRGSGNGKAAWNASMDYFKDNFTVAGYLLLVNEEWKGAQKIYESAGFREVVAKGTHLFLAEGKQLRQIKQKGHTCFSVEGESGEEYDKGDRPFSNFFPTADGNASDGILMIKLA